MISCQRSSGHKLGTQEVLLNVGKNFFALRVGGRALEGTAQGDHGVSLSEDIQNPPELIPVSAALGDPALPGRWTAWFPEVPSNPKNSVNL